MLKRIIKRILRYIIKVTQIHKLIQEQIDEDKISFCHSQVIGQYSVFHKDAKIENLSNNVNNIQIGVGTIIKGELLVWPHGGKIKIGDNSYVGPQVRIWSGSNDGISIGNNVLISHNVTIIDSDSHEIDHIERAESYKNMLKYGHPKVNNTVKVAPIVIHDNAWISYNVSILKGVTIGTGSIIGAGSIVTSDAPPFTLVAGNPAKVIKYLTKRSL